jgi:hypothetical protein
VEYGIHSRFKSSLPEPCHSRDGNRNARAIGLLRTYFAEKSQQMGYKIQKIKTSDKVIFVQQMDVNCRNERKWNETKDGEEKAVT